MPKLKKSRATKSPVHSIAPKPVSCASKRRSNPLVGAPAGSQIGKHANAGKRALDSRFRGNERPKLAAAPAPICDADDPMPADIEEFRRALVRRILTMTRMWRRCREPVCRRIKRCAGADMRCQRDHPPRKLTPEKQAAVKASIKRALERRFAQEAS